MWRKCYNDNRPRGPIGNRPPITLSSFGDEPGQSPQPYVG